MASICPSLTCYSLTFNKNKVRLQIKPEIYRETPTSITMSKMSLFTKKRTTSSLTSSSSSSSASSSMELPIVPRPVGINNNGGREFFHFSHPHHPLVAVTSPYLFTCMCCREYGAGKKFTCHSCYFDVHDFCASAPPSLLGHPFGNKHHLVFVTKSTGGFLRTNCDICDKPMKGYTYRCTTCNFEMHPTCSLLLPEMNLPTHHHSLKMSSTPSSGESNTSSSTCRMCMRRRSGCSYHCTTCSDYTLHAACAKNLVNGLHANGIYPPEKSNSRLGKAAKVASQVILGILEGLIEGFGEGIGEALVGRGRNRRNSAGSRRG